MIQPLENHPIQTPNKTPSGQLKGVEKVDRVSYRDHAVDQDTEIDPDKKREHSHGLGQDSFEKSEEESANKSPYAPPDKESTKTPTGDTSDNDGNLDITV